MIFPERAERGLVVRLAQRKHAVECDTRKITSALVDGNLIDDFSGAKIFESPQQVHRSDSEHGGANAHAGVKRYHLTIFQFLAEAIDHVNFGAHGPFRTERGSFDDSNDAFSGADFVG